MPQLNELGEYGLNQLLARRLTTPGPAPSPTVEPALFPALVLESDRPEWGFLKAEQRCAATSVVAAVAGQFGFSTLTNPVGSNLICVVEQIDVWTTTSEALLIPRQLTGAGALVTGQIMDSRGVPDGQSRAPRCQVTVGSSAAPAPEAPIFWFQNGNLNIKFDRPVIVRPGSCLHFEGLTVNVAFERVQWQWRERPAQPGEL